MLPSACSCEASGAAGSFRSMTHLHQSPNACSGSSYTDSYEFHTQSQSRQNASCLVLRSLVRLTESKGLGPSLDCCASRDAEIWIFRFDLRVVPGSDLTLHDLCQDTGRQLQALGISHLSSLFALDAQRSQNISRCCLKNSRHFAFQHGSTCLVSIPLRLASPAGTE